MDEKPRLQLKGEVFKEVYYVDEEGLPVFKVFINGEWVSKDSLVRVKTPIDGSTIAKLVKISWDDVDSALKLLYEKGRWSIRNMPGDSRVKAFHKAAELIEEHKEDFINTLVLDAGKPIKNAESEVEATIDRLKKVYLDARRIMGEFIPGDWSAETLETEAVIKREPHGVVLTIAPFNYPLHTTALKVVPALLAGNAVLIKPSTLDPLAVVLFTRVLELAGFPKDAVAVITLPGREMNKVVSDRRVRAILFTGSTETGIEIMKNAGIKYLQLELGGQDHAIVLSDADLKWAAERVARGIVSFSGQRCDALRVVLVEEGVYEEFKKLLIAEVRKYRLGDPRKEDVDLGPLITEEAAREVWEAIKDAVSKGGKVLTGGKEPKGAYIEPTVVEVGKDRLKEISAWCREVFGPLTLLVKVRNLDEAIEIANSSRYGLDAAVFSTDDRKLRKAARLLEVGAVFLNEYPRHGIGYYPFGGVKDSGIGREGIAYSIDNVTTYKSIVKNYRGAGIWEYI